MKLTDALSSLERLDKLGVYVFSTQDIQKMFSDEEPNTLNKSIARLVKANILIKASKGVYVFSKATSRNAFIIEKIALVLRRGFYSYLSLESALSEYGVISQIPIDRITIMTTGRKGEYKTPFGIIEFTHTKRDRLSIFKSVQVFDERPLPVATVDTAKRDLRRVGRNLEMIDESVED